MNHLSGIFNSEARVKLMRLFLFSRDGSFSISELKRRTHIPEDELIDELAILEDSQFVREKTSTQLVIVEKGKQTAVKPRGRGRPRKDEKIKLPKTKEVKMQVTTWSLDKTYPLLEQLSSLIIESQLIKTKDLYKKLENTGDLKLILLTGIFVKSEDRRVDILIVADKVNQKKLDKAIALIESEVGKELRYSVFTRDEFMYRIEMYDNLVFDVLQNKHEKVIDRLNIQLGK